MGDVGEQRDTLVSSRPPFGCAVILYRWGRAANRVNNKRLKIYVFIIIQSLAFLLCCITKRMDIISLWRNPVK